MNAINEALQLHALYLMFRSEFWVSHRGNASMLVWKLYNNCPAANTVCPNEEEEEDMLTGEYAILC